MARVERVTVSLADDLLREIDRREKNRSKFLADAVRNELERRRREDLRRSLQQPHPDTASIIEEGLADWARGLPEEEAEALVNPHAGTSIRWIPGQGWTEGE